LVCQYLTQDDNPQLGNGVAIINVFRGGKQYDLYPSAASNKASSSATLLAFTQLPAEICSGEHVYLVYEGKKRDH